MKNETQLPNTIVKLLYKQKKIKYINKRKVLKFFAWFISALIFITIIMVVLVMTGVIL